MKLDSKTSRRAFVGTAALGATAVIVGYAGTESQGGVGGGEGQSLISVVRGALGGGAVAETQHHTAEVTRWQGLVGQSFMLTGTGGTLSARIDSVTSAKVRGRVPANLRQETFRVHFLPEGNARAVGEQTYTASNATLGTLQMFLSSNAQGALTALFA